MNFASSLKQIRHRLGYKTAKSFYNYLEVHSVLSFNYSYYTRMEASSALPSSEVVNQIAKTLDKESAKQLIHSYCKMLFPNFSNMFEFLDSKTQELNESSNNKINFLNQSELTLRQVDVLAKSKAHYELFLILTLSRNSFSLTNLKEIIGINHKEICYDLQEVDILVSSNDKICSKAIEFKFPEPFNNRLKDQYSTFDKWDKELKDDWEFSNLRKKFFLRRTSVKHLYLLQGFLSQIDLLIKSSDEIDTSLNNEVLLFEYSLNSGKLPG